MKQTVANIRTAITTEIISALNSPNWYDELQEPAALRNFLAPAHELVLSGKRTRGLLLCAGWQAFNTEKLPLPAAAALELYQTSALIHDDLIDQADTRRGIPATHIAYTQQHETNNLLGNANLYGVNNAILLGDFLLSLAELTFADSPGASPEAERAGRKLFHAMSAEVAFGQYLDHQAEHLPLDNALEVAISRAFAVLYHKTARYSVDIPLRIGATLAGADTRTVNSLSAIGLPLGEAFQLRDDVLGIFGDPNVTGKPAGGDISEGKRTVLWGLARKMATSSEREILDKYLGNPVDASKLAQIKNIIVDSGAYSEHEKLIQIREKQAQVALKKLDLSAELLVYLIHNLSERKY